MSEHVPFDPAPQLARLKDFQRRTVDYVFRRMYLDDQPATRFLVADEVGLGKTLVARGLIARALEYLHDRVGRIDVVYVCSNAAIAAQNLGRLNVLSGDDDGESRQTSYATRLTLMPIHVHGLKKNRVNFVSFTPGTTFDPRSRGGILDERAVIWWMLRDRPGWDREGLWRLLRCAASNDSWWWHSQRFDDGSSAAPDADLAQAFVKEVEADADLKARLKQVADAFRHVPGDPVWELSNERYALVGDLRARLADVCLDALEADLVILDEFQRFKHLLDPHREEARLAQRLFNYRKEMDVRILLLSATPYKMYTVAGEAEDHHFRDFIETLRFLLHNDEAALADLQGEIRAYRAALRNLAAHHHVGDPEPALRSARDAVQSRLVDVMVRTERVAASKHRDAMVEERVVHVAPEPADLEQAVATDRIARAAGSHDVIEYWKSAPYLINFMKGYDLKRKLDKYRLGADDAIAAPPDLVEAFEAADPALLPVGSLRAYEPIEPANARLRQLLGDTTESGLWQLLWMPPSLPYLEPGPIYSSVEAASKTLVFSSWNVVPDSIAAVSSYEAERLMHGDGGPGVDYDELVRKRRGLLRFAVSGERFSGMGALLLGYPSPHLAAIGDPLALARRAGQPVALAEARAHVTERLRQSLREAGLPIDTARPDHDARWTWAAVARLDAGSTTVANWLEGDSGWRELARRSKRSQDDTGFEQVLDRFAEAFRATPDLGRPHNDLLDLLSLLALGGPATCALRALSRLVPERALDDPLLLQAAARIGEGFRTLFNVPETMGLLRAGDDDEDYWRAVITYAVDGNLQSVLDEHVHTLRDSLGLMDAPAETLVPAVAEAVADVLTLRTASLFVDDLRAASDEPALSVDDRFAFRTRFGLRFGDFQDVDQQIHRADLVRQAFNSPFRPFILASTSVGQEGLDFHTWCHRIVHWNLPTNPVDMEQREGRVHRYKGYAVRKNVAKRFGLAVLRDEDGQNESSADPWSRLFDEAVARRPEESDDLVPFWVYDEVADPVRVTRCVPLPMLSKEHERYDALKRSLTLYRLAFGQPRQQDLLHWLQQFDTSDVDTAAWQIDLRPPG